MISQCLNYVSYHLSRPTQLSLFRISLREVVPIPFSRKLFLKTFLEISCALSRSVVRPPALDRKGVGRCNEGCEVSYDLG
jgi:hypothetical protein